MKLHYALICALALAGFLYEGYMLITVTDLRWAVPFFLSFLICIAGMDVYDSIPSQKEKPHE